MKSSTFKDRFRVCPLDPHGNETCVKDFDTKKEEINYWESIGPKRGNLIDWKTDKRYQYNELRFN